MIKSRKKPEPYFLCIGPPKTGTSWLYSILDQHMDVDLPLYKELNFYYQEEFEYKRSIFAMFYHKDWYNRQRRSKLKKRLKVFGSNKKKIKQSGLKKNLLHILYLFFPTSHYLYQKLFDASGKISGDISPLYSSLKKEIITQVYKLHPDLKIVIIFRNPVERLWSHIKMKLTDEQLFSEGELVFKNLRPHIDLMIKGYSYCGIYENWTKVFPASQVKFFFYEDLKEDAISFFTSICAFLGIDAERIDFKSIEDLNKVVFKGRELEMTDEIYKYVVKNYQEDIVKLYKITPDSRIKSWLEGSNLTKHN